MIFEARDNKTSLRCRLCRNKLIRIASYKDFPIHNITTTNTEYKYTNFNLYKCTLKKCLLLQSDTEFIYPPNDYLNNIIYSRNTIPDILDIIESNKEICIPKINQYFKKKNIHVINPNIVSYIIPDHIMSILDRLNLGHEIRRDFYNYYIKIGSRVKPNSTQFNYQQYIKSITNEIKNVEYLIRNESGIYVVNAKYCQNLLLLSNIIYSKVKYCLDDNKSNHHKYIYGTSVKCAPFDFVREGRPTIVMGAYPVAMEDALKLRSINENVNILY